MSATRTIHQLKVFANATEDAHGRPTVEVTLSDGEYSVHAKVPTGDNSGTRGAKELRDRDSDRVDEAIANINGPIADMLRLSAFDPLLIDKKLLELDGTPDKSRLGANALLGVSMATRRLAALHAGVPLWKFIAHESNSLPAFPRLYMNMLCGGVYADFRLPFQEYMVVVGGKDPVAMYHKATTIFGRLSRIMKTRYPKAEIGREGGYSPMFADMGKPFEILREAAAHEPDTFLALDAAAGALSHNGLYVFNRAVYTKGELLAVYKDIVDRFDVQSIEDPFDKGDIEGFQAMTKVLGGQILVVGDDLTLTDPTMVRRIAFAKGANAMLVKPNQVGTIAEVYAAAVLARSAGWKLVAGHASGETDDTFVSDLAVGLGCYGIKAGAPNRQECRVKYERLMGIGKEFFANMLVDDVSKSSAPFW